MHLRALAFGSLFTLLLAATCLAEQPSRSTSAAHRPPTASSNRAPAATSRSSPARPSANTAQTVRPQGSNASRTDSPPTVETPHLDRTLAETGRLPIVARGDLRDEIKSLDINERPHRPLHFYGNTVRRRTGASSTAN